MAVVLKFFVVFSILYGVGLIAGLAVANLGVRSLEVYFDAQTLKLVKDTGNLLGFVLLLVSAYLASSWRVLSFLHLIECGPLTIRDVLKRHILPISIGFSLIGTIIAAGFYLAASLHYTGHMAVPGMLRLLGLFAIQAFCIHFLFSQSLKKSIQRS